MNKFIYTTLVFGVLCCTIACRKYVEIPSDNLKVLKLTSDYQQLMYNTTTMNYTYLYPAYAASDYGTDQVSWQNLQSVVTGNAYTWADRMFTTIEDDPQWTNLYKQIFIANTVIGGVMSSERGTDAEKLSAISSAYMHRAFAYYTLVNLYAKQYDAATAATDPGVPLVMSTDFFTDLTRASVQKVYDLITADLNQALPGLPDLPDFNSNPSKSGVYAIMARVELNRRNFTEAERYANLALGLKNTLLNLSAYTVVPLTIPTRTFNPEVIFFKQVQISTSFPLSPDMLSLFTANENTLKDLRYTMFTKPGPDVVYSNFTTRGFFRQTMDGVYNGPSVPEMLLIKAECEARAGNTAAALTALNTLRIKRFKTDDYIAATAADANTALHLVIDERGREFMGTGFKWFDQRRLSKDTGFVPAISRVFKGVTYTLEPGGNRYTFAIADKYTLLNPEIAQNPR